MAHQKKGNIHVWILDTPIFIRENRSCVLRSLYIPYKRCTLPQVQLLNFEVAPVLTLKVNPTTEDCTVEMLSCKFEGSDLVEQQNDHFLASMVNRITWETVGSQTFLDVDVKLNISLEIYTMPFTMLPTSAVESPGNIMMQALVDRLVPLLLQQLLQDYDNWVRQYQKSLL
ncbi:hypothetical protein KY290_034271 [Solanum tuberosum]|uniref:DUF1997 domain-containing protein n=1 Tax=Solanum tuberosum TaxID=4113 RepID=A0ABQ7U4J3_SOLTU|nr:hypothetical protein KY290_034271 [Solanum tuberosum]